MARGREEGGRCSQEIKKVEIKLKENTIRQLFPLLANTVISLYLFCCFVLFCCYSVVFVIVLLLYICYCIVFVSLLFCFCYCIFVIVLSLLLYRYCIVIVLSFVTVLLCYCYCLVFPLFLIYSLFVIFC